MIILEAVICGAVLVILRGVPNILIYTFTSALTSSTSAIDLIRMTIVESTLHLVPAGVGPPV